MGKQTENMKTSEDILCCYLLVENFISLKESFSEGLPRVSSEVT